MICLLVGRTPPIMAKNPMCDIENELQKKSSVAPEQLGKSRSCYILH